MIPLLIGLSGAMAISRVRDAPASLWKQRRYYLTLPDVPAHVWRFCLEVRKVGGELP